LQVGEAVAALVLEGRRGDRRGRFEILDGVVAHDPGHIAAGSTDGVVACRVMTDAIKRSGVRPEQVTAIKAHGTGTESNDLSEIRGLNAAFPNGLPPFASLKGMFGHTLGASSALETVMWLWSLEEGFIPSSCGFQNAAPGMPTPLTQPEETHGKPGIHLINSFGFGGTAVSFLISDRGAA
jgi:3-oxoacyl-(acyl-carrier-protein) synthase